MVTENFCLNPHALEATAREAGHFATLSAILAGLTFSSMLTLFTNPPEKESLEKFSSHMLTLLVVVALFLMATFLLIPVAGARFRPEQEINFLLSNMVLALAVIEMFLAISWFFWIYGTGEASNVFTKWMFFTVVFVVGVNVYNTINSIHTNLTECFSGYKNSKGFDWPLIVVAVVLPFGFGLIRWLNPPEDFSRPTAWSRKVAAASMVAGVAAALAYVYVLGVWSRPNLELAQSGKGENFVAPAPAWFRYVIAFPFSILAGLSGVSLPPRQKSARELE